MTGKGLSNTFLCVNSIVWTNTFEFSYKVKRSQEKTGSTKAVLTTTAFVVGGFLWG